MMELRREEHIVLKLLYWLHRISVLKKRVNDSSIYFFSLLFQYQTGGDKVSCMAIYSPVLKRIPGVPGKRGSMEKFLSIMVKNNTMALGTHPLQVFLQ